MLSLSPDYAFLSLVSDPATGEHTIRLESLKNEIGRYDVTATLSNEDPFSLIPPIEYDFEVFIHPCTLDDLIITPPDSVSFEIGSPETILPYAV